MKTFVRELIISLVFVLSSFLARSQTHDFEFTYDDSGNRYLRTMLRSAPATIATASKETSKEIPPVIDKKNDELSLEIYPNPTKGIINLDVKGVGNEKVRLFIFSTQGRLLDAYYVSSGITNVNITKFPPGLYLLKVIFKDKTSEVKIVKE